MRLNTQGRQLCRTVRYFAHLTVYLPVHITSITDRPVSPNSQYADRALFHTNDKPVHKVWRCVCGLHPVFRKIVVPRLRVTQCKISWPSIWMHNNPSKHQEPFTQRHSVTSQTTCFLNDADLYAVPRLRRSVAKKTRLQSQTSPSELYGGQSGVPRLSAGSIIPPMLRTHSFTYHRHCIILATISILEKHIHKKTSLSKLPISQDTSSLRELKPVIRNLFCV